VPGGARNVEWVGSPTLWVGLRNRVKINY
jgi:hypothetical protein